MPECILQAAVREMVEILRGEAGGEQVLALLKVTLIPPAPCAFLSSRQCPLMHPVPPECSNIFHSAPSVQ